ncbi:ankyrin repeat domain-containing protein [Candidatus Dependentiae bacterium]|nr:ankyrin repeat domain-containing protein [Candidatus Dependentiae bacterium]
MNFFKKIIFGVLSLSFYANLSFAIMDRYKDNYIFEIPERGEAESAFDYEQKICGLLSEKKITYFTWAAANGSDDIIKMYNHAYKKNINDFWCEEKDFKYKVAIDEKHPIYFKPNFFLFSETDNYNFLNNRILRLGPPIPKIDAKDGYGHTPLMVAAIFGRFDVVKNLIKIGADSYKQSFSGRTALLYAAMFNNADIFKLLVNYREKCVNKIMDLDEFDLDGNNALIFATLHGNIDLIIYLIEKTELYSTKCSLDLDKKNKQGFTALSYARKKGFKEIENILKKYGALDEKIYLRKKRTKENIKIDDKNQLKKRKYRQKT